MCNLSYARCIISLEVNLEARLYREFFRALSNQTRFSIVQLLRDRPHYVNEMVEKLGIEKHLVKYAPALDSCQTLESELKPVVVIAKAKEVGPGSRAIPRKRK